MAVKAHVTCGRGTEVFVRAELLAKLRCTVSSVEDGKVFFALEDIPSDESDPDGCIAQVFSLKTVERIFATVAHFPTADIKGNGKVKFLHALKDRILNKQALMDAVDSVHRLRRTRQLHSQSHQTSSTPSTHKGNESATMDTQQKSAAAHSEHDPDNVRDESEVPEASRTDTDNLLGSRLITAGRQHSVYVSGQKNEDAEDLHHLQHDKKPQKASFTFNKELPENNLPEHPLSTATDFINSLCKDGPTQQSHTTKVTKTKSDGYKRTKADCADVIASDTVDCNGGTTEPPAKLRRYDSADTTLVTKQVCQSHSQARCDSGRTYTSVQTGEVRCGGEGLGASRSVEEERRGGEEEGGAAAGNAVSFRFSVKCAGWCRKWMQPQRLAKELSIRLTIMTGWTSQLTSPDLEICVHVNDDFVTVGIPLTRIPLSKRDYLQDAGLRSTICWIMAQQADIQPGHFVLDPMCGKATILIEAAREQPQAAHYLGCDIDRGQLQSALTNLSHADLWPAVHLLRADALNLPLKSGSMDRIVCDAPFGNKFTVTSSSLPQFYTRMMQEMYRLLAAEGRAVLLTSQNLLPLVQEHCSHWRPKNQGHSSPPVQENSNTAASAQFQETFNVLQEDVASSVAQEDGASSSVTQEDCGSTSGAQDDECCTLSCPEKTLSEHNTFVPRLENSGKLGSVHNSVGVRCHVTAGEIASERQDLVTPGGDGGGGGIVKLSSDLEASTTTTTVSTSLDCGQGVKAKKKAGGTTTTTACQTQQGRFSLLSSHYIKLGETHAYIVVLQK